MPPEEANENESTLYYKILKLNNYEIIYRSKMPCSRK